MKVTFDTDDYVREIRKQFEQRFKDKQIEVTPMLKAIVDNVTQELKEELAEKEPQEVVQTIIERAVDDRMNKVFESLGFFFDIASKAETSEPHDHD